MLKKKNIFFKFIYQAKKKYDILKKIDNKLVPKAIKFKESKEYAYLITEYMDGKSLYYYRKADSQFSSKDILWELA